MNLLAPCDALYRKLPSHPYFWLLIWITWFSVLWMLSSRVPEIKHGPKIPHFDKVAHFCYFTAGGFLMANFLHLKTSFPWRFHWHDRRRRILLLHVAQNQTIEPINIAIFGILTKSYTPLSTRSQNQKLVS